MDDYQLLIDLHKRANRQGPGGETASAQALNLAGVSREVPLKVADIGCGTGASTLFLAQGLNAEITAVDFLPEFLEVLKGRAEKLGLSAKIKPLCCSMEQLPFEDGTYDLIWSEGAIYNMGFAQGVAAWKRYLKKGGVLVVSEITWTTSSRPAEIESHWQQEYPEIDLASAKMAVLEQNGYTPCGYFVLPEACWLDYYYYPLQHSFQDFLDRQGNSAEAQAIVAAEQQEIELYQTYKNYYSYGVYIARKVED
ncbi:MAG: class I SAM-dependent methyltransferase [Prochlorotrichaceae cyanobacterium]